MAFDPVLYDDVIAAFTVDANHLREMAAKIVEGGRDALFRRRMPYACVQLSCAGEKRLPLLRPLCYDNEIQILVKEVAFSCSHF